MAHVYISYSREDGDFVDLIEADLSDRGHDTWRDTSDIHAGNDWGEAIAAALDDAYALVAVLSNKSVTSDWLKREIHSAQNNQTPIIAVQLEACGVPTSLGDALLVDFSKISGKQGIEQVRQYRQALNLLITALDDTRPLLLYLKQLSDHDDDVRERAARELGELGDLEASEALINALTDDDVDVRFAAAEALGILKCVPALRSLVRLMDDDDPDVCAEAASALGRIGGHEAIGPLTERLEHEDRVVRGRVARALGHLKAEGAVRSLVHMMRNDPISDVRAAATFALCAIGGAQAERALKRLRVDCANIPSA